jgi:hypothetical protein
MKPDLVPFFRDGGRILVTDLAEFTHSRAASEPQSDHPHGKKAMRLLAWPNAKWWRALVVRGESAPFESHHPLRDEAVLASWHRLGEGRRWEVANFADALHLLVETPAVETYGNGVMPDGGADPRPFLADRGSVRDWLVGRVDLWEPSVVRLLGEGRLSREAARRLLRHRPKVSCCPDPHALVHFGFTGDIASLHWDDRLVRSTLPFFRGGCLREVRAAAALVEVMLDGDGRHATVTQRFLAETSFETSAPWLSRVAAVRDPERRRHFLERLAAAEARKKSPRAIPVRLIQKIEQRARRFRRECLELGGVFQVVERGIDPGVLEDGFTLAEWFPTEMLDVSIPSNPLMRPDLGGLAELVRRFQRDQRHGCRCRFCLGAWRVQDLWERALTSRELSREIATGTWRDFPEVMTQDWVDFLNDLHAMNPKPREFRTMIDRVSRSILREPAKQRRVKGRVLACLIGFHRHLPATSVLDDLETLASTIAAGFSSIDSEAMRLFHDLYAVASEDQRWSLGNLPRSVVNHLKEAARNDQERGQIGRGGLIWLRALPDADPGLLFRRPKRFLDALRDLGTLPESETGAICGYLRDHPGFGIDPVRIDLREACFLLDTILREGETDPLPEKLRDAACGRIVLSVAAMQHYRMEFAGRLADYQIDLLLDRIREVETRYRREGLDPHTIRFLAGLGKSNRRALKRFLQAIREGRSDYRESHPANRAWLEKHRDLSLGEWLSGATLSHPVAVPGFEGAFVQLEDDPQETLKMGTYADTCLGIGGCNQHAAVANALDLNKRVAFLRDRQGKPLARQLLVISEERTLVPFEVYLIEGTIDRTAVERIFHEFDEGLARRIGLPRWNSGSEYRVRPLVARDWYDDQAWTMRA